MESKIFCHVFLKYEDRENQPTDPNELIGESKESRVVTLPSHLYEPLATALDLLTESIGDLFNITMKETQDHGGSLVVEGETFNLTITRERVLC